MEDNGQKFQTRTLRYFYQLNEAQYNIKIQNWQEKPY
jgi:hypothetical protein